MNKRILLWGGLAAAVVLIILFVMRMADEGTPAVEHAEDIPESVQQVFQIKDNDWVKGNPDADVVIVKYSDFQCPACRRFAQFDAQAEAELGDQVAFVFRHFPLRNFEFTHEAHRYAEAAGQQGEFWRMHNLLYRNQSRWSLGNASDIFRQFAEGMNLDMEQFENDLNSSAVQERIQQNYNEGVQIGVRSVPSIYINGRRIDLPPNGEAYIDLIKSFL